GKAQSRRDARRRGHFGDDDARAGAAARYAVELQLIVRPVDYAQPLVHIAQADAAPRDALHLGCREPDAVVNDVDDGMAALPPAADGDPAAAELLGEPVLDGVFDERLQQHARDDELEGCRIDRLVDLELRPEAHA